MRVRFIGGMIEKGYSGGRLLALGMAEALAIAGAKVDFITNCVPEMYKEFEPFSRVRIKTADFRNMSPWVDRMIDVVIIIPGGAAGYHSEWVRHAIECRAKIILLNFESPNWFNKVSPFKRRMDLWAGWDIVSEHADLILSISAEGNKYARAYYSNCPQGCLFDFCYPGINTILADKAPEASRREKRIVLLSRADPHKGYDALDALPHRDLAGFSVVVYLGTGHFPKWKAWLWKKKFEKAGMKIEVQNAITGVDKFTMLKNSACLFFPTRFEGFGLPPLEAAYCLMPCACSDLPVLKEFGQGAFSYGDPDNPGDMRRAILESLKSQERVIKEHDRISRIARIDEWGKRVAKTLERIA